MMNIIIIVTFRLPTSHVRITNNNKIDFATKQLPHFMAKIRATYFSNTSPDKIV